MRLISWNLARRVQRLAEQAAALASRGPDMVALQEVTARTWPLWEAAEPLPVPWPETTLARAVEGVVFHTVHVPNAANGWIKIETLEAPSRLARGRAERPRAVRGRSQAATGASRSRASSRVSGVLPQRAVSA